MMRRMMKMGWVHVQAFNGATPKPGSPELCTRNGQAGLDDDGRAV